MTASGQGRKKIETHQVVMVSFIGNFTVEKMLPSGCGGGDEVHIGAESLKAGAAGSGMWAVVS